MASTSKSMKALQTRLSDLAVKIGKDLELPLDYSEASISNVERILSEIHKDYKKTRDPEGLNGIALNMSAYIITVLEKHHPPGKWERDHPDFGKASFPYIWNKSTIFPYAWCLKRIFDGPADNVISKYQEIVIKACQNT